MRIEHPYSLLVRDGRTAWSCGQCPLDSQGSVLAPGDLREQTNHVVDLIEQVLQRAELSLHTVGKLIVYHVAANPEAVAGMLAILLRRFGPDTILVPVAVPHFYYQGML